MSRFSDLLLGTTGLVSAWPLGEASGTTAVDAKGTDTGTYVNSPALNQPGLPGGLDSAVVFTAASSHHVTMGNTGGGFGNGPYSFGVWFKTTASGANFAMLDLQALTGASGDIGLGLGNLANGRVTVTDGGNRIISSAAAPLYNDGKWHLAIATKTTGNVWTLFVDGIDVTTADSFPAQTTTSGATTNGRIAVQYNAGTQRWFFTGTLQHPFVANVALTLTDARRLYEAGLGGSPPLLSSALFERVRSLRGGLLMQPAAAAIDTNVVPGTASLSLASFAPAIAITANQTVVPGVGSLVLTAFAPQVNLVVSPPTASLVLANFAPVIQLAVVPPTASLTLASFAPTVAVSNNQLVTPGVASLTLTTFAPVIRLTVVPGLATLTLTTFAPAVAVSNNQLAVPGVASLTTTAFAPVIRLTVIPPVAALTLTTFAPVIAISNHQLVTPGVKALALTTFAPTVTGGGNLVVTPSVAALAMTAFAPTAIVSDHKLVTPPAAALALTTFAPSVGAPTTVIPSTAALALATFAPAVSLSGTVTSGPATVGATSGLRDHVGATAAASGARATARLRDQVEATPTPIEGGATASIRDHVGAES